MTKDVKKLGLDEFEAKDRIGIGRPPIRDAISGSVLKGQRKDDDHFQNC